MCFLFNFVKAIKVRIKGGSKNSDCSIELSETRYNITAPSSHFQSLLLDLDKYFNPATKARIEKRKPHKGDEKLIQAGINHCAGSMCGSTDAVNAGSRGI